MAVYAMNRGSTQGVCLLLVTGRCSGSSPRTSVGSQVDPRPELQTILKNKTD